MLKFCMAVLLAAVVLTACSGVRTSDGGSTFYGEIRSGVEVSHTKVVR